jgi:hypothetical protein
MKRLMGLTVAGLMGLALVAPAKALMIAPPALPLRVATVDAILVGKVTGFGPKLVKAEMFKGDMRDMQIANVKVSDTVLGKPAKEVKVGFFPAQGGPGGVRPGGGRPFIRRPGAQLTVGQEAMLLLTKHPTKDVYTVEAYFNIINKKDNPNFAKELAEIKKSTKLLADPEKGLKSKNADDRFTTAAMLITRYRTPRGNNATEFVPAAESKALLTALAEADWAPKVGGPRVGFALTPQTIFYRLNLEPKDNWTQPKDFKEFPAEAKKWLKENAGKYKMERYIGTKLGKATKAEASSKK